MLKKEMILTLRYWGYTNKDIAEILGIAPGTVGTTVWKDKHPTVANKYALENYYKHRDRRIQASRARYTDIRENHPDLHKRLCLIRKFRHAGVKLPEDLNVPTRKYRVVFSNPERDEGTSL